MSRKRRRKRPPRTRRRRPRRTCRPSRSPRTTSRRSPSSRSRTRRQVLQGHPREEGRRVGGHAPVSAKANAEQRALAPRQPEGAQGQGEHRQVARPRTRSTSSPTRRRSTVVAYKGADKAVDLYFGKSGSRGQMARIGGKDGVYVVGGYSSYLYTREVKNWRETLDPQVRGCQRHPGRRENKNGAFSFSKNGEVVGVVHEARQGRQARQGPREEVGEVRRSQGQGPAPRLQGPQRRGLRRREEQTRASPRPRRTAA
jgi:hypothetical protein